MSQLLRLNKYTIGATALDWLIRHTKLLDGKQQPPDFINFAGVGSFTAAGDYIVSRLIQEANLQDQQKVLEIGCAIGRNATALQRKSLSIEYYGFDIVSFGISWCQKHFSNKPNFVFEHANIYNSFYNPLGKIRAEEYSFAFASNSADLVFAASVFTHMPRDQVIRYLHESHRCMKADARAFFTFFLLDKESKEAISSGKSAYSFKYEMDGAWTEFQEEPDVAVAYDHDDMAQMIRQSGLEIVTTHYGQWRGNNQNIDFQDVLVLRKI